MLRILVMASLAVMSLSKPSFSQTDSERVEFRRPRIWAVSGEIGMNSLSSLVGPTFTYLALPRIALDAGMGISSSGLRPGVRARYLFSMEKTSFFGGIGFKYGFGSFGKEAKVEDPDTKKDLHLKTGQSAFADGMLGVDFTANNGFMVVGSAGWSQLLSNDPYTFTSGTPSDKAKKAYDTIFGSGILLSVSLGKAF